MPFVLLTVFELAVERLVLVVIFVLPSCFLGSLEFGVPCDGFVLESDRQVREQWPKRAVDENLEEDGKRQSYYHDDGLRKGRLSAVFPLEQEEETNQA